MMIDLHAAMAADGHEEALFWQDAGSGLRAIAVLHDTTLGPALGGVRLRAYAQPDDAIVEALQLARVTTYANALAGLDLGGGSAVILAEADARDEILLRALGRRVETLGGRFIATTEAGTRPEEMDAIGRETRHVAGRSQAFGGRLAASALTAKTVYLGMQAAVQTALGEATLRNLTVAVQGAGKVGCRLIERLVGDGAHVVVTDSDPERARRAASRFGARLVGVESIYDVECHVFSPNALGGALNERTIPRLRCRIVCGGASQQLESPGDGDRLAAREVLYVPDFAVNCGGAIAAAEELAGGSDAARAEARADQTFGTILQVFALAAQQRTTPTAAATQLAEQRIAAVARLRRPYLPPRNPTR
jgi:glutamate dehydrogenase/leucine dehydrogenase